MTKPCEIDEASAGAAEESAKFLGLQSRLLWYSELHFSWATFIRMAEADPGLRAQVLRTRPLPIPIDGNHFALFIAQNLVRVIESRLAALDALK